MKCPRCRNQMRRREVKIHTYTYVCPNCGLKLPVSTERVSDDRRENEQEQE